MNWIVNHEQLFVLCFWLSVLQKPVMTQHSWRGGWASCDGRHSLSANHNMGPLMPPLKRVLYFLFLCYFHTEPWIWCRTVYFACVLKEYTCILHISVRRNDLTFMFRTEPWWIRLIYAFYTNISVYICLNQPTLKPLFSERPTTMLKNIFDVVPNQCGVIALCCSTEGAQTAYELNWRGFNKSKTVGNCKNC